MNSNAIHQDKLRFHNKQAAVATNPKNLAEIDPPQLQAREGHQLL